MLLNCRCLFKAHPSFRCSVLDNSITQTGVRLQNRSALRYFVYIVCSDDFSVFGKRIKRSMSSMWLLRYMTTICAVCYRFRVCLCSRYWGNQSRHLRGLTRGRYRFWSIVTQAGVIQRSDQNCQVTHLCHLSVTLSHSLARFLHRTPPPLHSLCVNVNLDCLQNAPSTSSPTPLLPQKEKQEKAQLLLF